MLKCLIPIMTNLNLRFYVTLMTEKNPLTSSKRLFSGGHSDGPRVRGSVGWPFRRRPCFGSASSGLAPPGNPLGLTKASPRIPQASPRPPQASPRPPQDVPKGTPKAFPKDFKDYFKILEKPGKNNGFSMIFKSVWASNWPHVGLRWLMLAHAG